MKTPYEVLETPENSDDNQVKKAYLTMVRRYPPERCPDDFQRIYRAYEQIKTEEDRLAYRLFNCAAPTSADIAALLLTGESDTKRPTVEEFQKRLDQDITYFLTGFQI